MTQIITQMSSLQDSLNPLRELEETAAKRFRYGAETDATSCTKQTAELTAVAITASTERKSMNHFDLAPESDLALASS